MYLDIAIKTLIGYISKHYFISVKEHIFTHLRVTGKNIRPKTTFFTKKKKRTAKKSFKTEHWRHEQNSLWLLPSLGEGCCILSCIGEGELLLRSVIPAPVGLPLRVGVQAWVGSPGWGSVLAYMAQFSLGSSSRSSKWLTEKLALLFCRALW